MAYEAIEKVRRHSRVKGTKLALLYDLADRVNQARMDANGEMIAYPGITTLAEASNVNRHTVRRSLRELVEAGELEDRGHDGHGYRVFAITLDRLPEKEELPPERSEASRPDSADRGADMGITRPEMAAHLAGNGRNVGRIRPDNQKGTRRGTSSAPPAAAAGAPHPPQVEGVAA
jgi:Replication protein C N-terminal domain